MLCSICWPPKPAAWPPLPPDDLWGLEHGHHYLPLPLLISGACSFWHLFLPSPLTNLQSQPSGHCYLQLPPAFPPKSVARLLQHAEASYWSPEPLVWPLLPVKVSRWPPENAVINWAFCSLKLKTPKRLKTKNVLFSYGACSHPNMNKYHRNNGYFALSTL